MVLWGGGGYVPDLAGRNNFLESPGTMCTLSGPHSLYLHPCWLNAAVPKSICIYWLFEILDCWYQNCFHCLLLLYLAYFSSLLFGVCPAASNKLKSLADLVRVAMETWKQGLVFGNKYYVVTGVDLALRYFWGGDGDGEVFSRISRYQKFIYALYW